MTRAAGLVLVVGLVLAVRVAMPGVSGGAAAAMALGFVLVVSFLLGGLATRVGLPMITGFLLVGMLAGPYLLGWLHPALAILGHGSVSSLRLLDALALGLISLTAGGELRLGEVRRNARVIGGVLLAQVVLVFAGCTALLWLFHDRFALLAALPGSGMLAAALLLGAIATANSPATALAIIQETRARGPVTEIVLSVTVAKDVVVISLFTVLLAVAIALARPDATLDLTFLGGLAWELTGSIAVGVGLGWLVSQYVNRLGHELPLLILGVAFLAMVVLPPLHLSGLLALMVAGFTIENFSRHGEELIEAIERHSLPVYVVFFTIAGASLDLGALATTLPLALALAALRIAATAGGTALGARWAGAPAEVLRYGWTGFTAQAGVTLGFAILIEQRFPEIGATVKTVTLAVVALNQLVGPVLFRHGLLRAGEARQEER